MPWVRLEDAFAEHPKVVSLPYRGRWLYIAALCYSNRRLTDGFVPLAILATLCPHERDDPQTEDAYHLADQLVDVGLWETAEGGFAIHDYHHYQPSKREVMEARARLRKLRSKAGKQGVSKREANRDAKRHANREANGHTNGMQSGSKV
jgi:hypothetical protein